MNLDCLPSTALLPVGSIHHTEAQKPAQQDLPGAASLEMVELTS